MIVRHIGEAYGDAVCEAEGIELSLRLRTDLRRPHRSDDRRGDDLVARDTRWRAKLGLPLQLAAGLDVHAVGLSTLGFDREAADYFYFIVDRVEAGDLQIMYGIDGRAELDEETLDHLFGYEGARPVRVGNDAWHHRQA